MVRLVTSEKRSTCTDVSPAGPCGGADLPPGETGDGLPWPMPSLEARSTLA
jgi:hypothetical protein